LEGCLEDLNSALALDPVSIDCLSTRAFAHLQLGDLASAKSDFATIERLDAKNGPKIQQRILEGLISRARSKSAKGDHNGEISDWDIVIGLVPEHGLAYHERGAAKSDLKRYKEAIADLDLAIKFDGWHNRFGDSYFLRAQAKKAIGDLQGAELDEKSAGERAAR
jgi:tetratricopeptide (TPR) repeat protein